MAETDQELQRLRREVARLEEKNRELETIHQLDLAEITKLRRQVEMLVERK